MLIDEGFLENITAILRIARTAMENRFENHIWRANNYFVINRNIVHACCASRTAYPSKDIFILSTHDDCENKNFHFPEYRPSKYINSRSRRGRIYVLINRNIYIIIRPLFTAIYTQFRCAHKQPSKFMYSYQQ